MKSTLDFPHHSSENTLQESSASHPVEAHAHSGLNATATGSARADSPVFAWLQASAQTVRSAATALRDEVRQHLPAPKEVAAFGTATLGQLSIAAEGMRSFIVAETTQTLLGNTLGSCITMTDKAFKTMAGPLTQLPFHTSDASAFVLKMAAAAIPASRVLCSAVITQLQALGSTVWHDYQNAVAGGAEKSAAAADLAALFNMPATADTCVAAAGAAQATQAPAHTAVPDAPALPPVAPAPPPTTPDSLPGFARDDLLSILAQVDSMSVPADSDTDDEDSQQAPDLVSLNRTMSQDLPQLPMDMVLITGRMEITEDFDSAIAPMI